MFTCLFCVVWGHLELFSAIYRRLGFLNNDDKTEPKYNLSYILFKTISLFRKLNNCFIICPKHTVLTRSRFYVRLKSKCIIFRQIMRYDGRDRGREAKWRISNFPRFCKKVKALLNLSMYFSKISYHRVHLGKI